MGTHACPCNGMQSAVRTDRFGRVAPVQPSSLVLLGPLQDRQTDSRAHLLSLCGGALLSLHRACGRRAQDPQAEAPGNVAEP
jgi:hypothetical protein